MKKNLVKNSVPKIINIVRNIKRLDNGLDKIDRKYYRNK